MTVILAIVLLFVSVKVYRWGRRKLSTSFPVIE